MDTILVRQGKSANMGSTLFALMARLPAETVDNVTYNWWERDPVRRSFYTNAGTLTSGATSLTFDDGAGNSVWPLLDDGAILHNNRTGERIVVVGAATADAVTVTRAQMGTTGVATTAAALQDNDVWTLIGTPKGEGANPGRASYEQPVSLLNYIQTFNSVVSLTNLYKAGVLRTDKTGPLTQLKVQALEKVCNDIELGLFFGAKGTRTNASGQTVYTTGGIQCAVDTAAAADSTLSANVLNGLSTTGITLDAFLAWLQSFMVNGSDSKIAFCGPLAYSALSRYANSAAGGFRIMNNESNVFGMNLTEIQTPFGAISLCMHPLFKNVALYNDFMVVVDLQLIKQKIMEPLFYQDGIAPLGSANYEGQYRAALGLKLQFAGAFGYAYGLRQINA